MTFHIITIFPHIFDSYFSESIIKRAVKHGQIGILIHNLRDYTGDKHRTVDDKPYGGGPGMILKIEPIYKTIQSIKSLKSVKSKARIILFSAKGKKFTQKEAKRLAKYENLILICGRYEGVDERVAQHLADEEISIGDYVLTGGEIPAMVLVDSIARLKPGVLGNPQSLDFESFNSKANNDSIKAESALEYPQYTKPQNFRGWKVPKILLTGNHGKIKEWRIKKCKNNHA